MSMFMLLVISGSSQIFIQSAFGDYWSATPYYDSAVELNNDRKYDEALIAIKNATKEYPQFTNAYIWEGIILNNLERDNESLAPLDKAISLYNEGTNQESVRRYNGVYNDKGDAYLWKGHALFNLGRYNESSDAYSLAINAYADYDKALDKEPNSSSCHTDDGALICHVYYPSGVDGLKDENFAEEVKSEKAATLDTLSEVYYWKGYSLYIMAIPEEALKYYEKAKAINQNLSPYYNESSAVESK